MAMVTRPARATYDVFLCHDSRDKAAVKGIGKQLKARGLRPWLDEWELRPGQPWQRELERLMDEVGAAAVFVGPGGWGPWQELEVEGLLRQFVKRSLPVIPCLLPQVPDLPELPHFLKQFTWVDFGRTDPDPLEQLIWGITGERPVPDTARGSEPHPPTPAMPALGIDLLEPRDSQGRIGGAVDTRVSTPTDPEAEKRHFLASVPWGPALLERLAEDRAGLTHLRSAGQDRWLLRVRLPKELQEAYGTAPQILVLAVRGEVQGPDLKKAQQELFNREFDLDVDLLVIVDDRPKLARRLGRLFWRWGQWIPWSPTNGGFAPLGEQFRTRLPLYDVFEQRDPVRGRQVIGRQDVVSDLAKRLLRGQALGVFGLRKVGKTTAVRAVTDRLDPLSAPLRLRPDPDGNEPALLVAWLDMERVHQRTVEGVATRLVLELERRLELEKLPVPELRGHALAQLDALLEATLESCGVPMAIVLDEYELLFEGIAEGETADPGIQQLFRLLRGHAQESARLALVVIGRDPHFFQGPEMNGRPNPMLNWFIPQWLGPLPPAEADELLMRLGRRVRLDVGPQTCTEARRLTGGHPLLHRLFGSSLLKLAGPGGDGESHVATDPLCEAATECFIESDAVLETCREVFHLLEERYQEGETLLTHLCHESHTHAAKVIEADGGWHAPGTRVLRNFGLLLGEASSPRVPEVLRWYQTTFRTVAT